MRKNVTSNKNTDSHVITFTKKWVSRILWFGVLWVTCSYVLAFMGQVEIAQSLSVQVVKIVIATVLGYMLKAYFETYSQENMKYKKELNKIGIKDEEVNNTSYFDDSDYTTTETNSMEEE